MRLYRMELYKLCHKKTFIIWSAITMLVSILYFWLLVDDQMSTVKGVTYHGYDAIKIDRQITEAYRGGLTDAKVQQIVKEYGLPSQVEYGYGWWRDANYLNEYVVHYLSDGYIVDWNEYEVPTRAYAIADTELGDLQQAMGKEIPFDYTIGWQVFFDVLQLGMMLASILVIFSISVVFAQERQTGMLPLLFTAQKGKETDAKAKIAAAFTLTVIIYGGVVLFTLLLCVCVFGLDGAECPLNLAMFDGPNSNNKFAYMPVASFGWMVIGFYLLAMLLLCAITVCVSAYCSSNFGAVTIAASLWGLPFLLRIVCGGLGYFLTSCMPIFLVMTDSIYESISWGRTVPTISVALGLLAACVNDGYCIYKKRT